VTGDEQEGRCTGFLGFIVVSAVCVRMGAMHSIHSDSLARH
jgi:hypothetical protein